MLSLVALLPCVTAMPLRPTGAGQADRAARRAGTVLRADKVVLQPARDNREQLPSGLRGISGLRCGICLSVRIPILRQSVMLWSPTERTSIDLASHMGYWEAIKQCLPVALLCGGKLELRGTSHLTRSLVGPMSIMLRCQLRL